MKKIFLRKNPKVLNRLSFRKPVFSSGKNFLPLIIWLILSSFLIFLTENQLKGVRLPASPKIKRVSFTASHLPREGNEHTEEELFISQVPSTFQSSILGENTPRNNFLLTDKDSIVSLASFTNKANSYGQTSAFAYRVRRGDTLIGIARRFNVSLTTILSANHLKSNSVIRPGMELTVLPVTGILYQVQENESLESVSSKFRIPLKDLKKFNHLKDGKVSPGQTLVIPGIVERIRSSAKESVENYKNLPSLRGYFTPPCKGWNRGILHKNNAVDISNLCGTPINAAQEGLVIKAKSGWNKGYGNFVEIQHPNGTRTLYAYLKSILVKEGDYVKKGEEIGTMGNSGQRELTKSCHLHFEVHGAKNFLAE